MHFMEREPDMMALGGRLLADIDQGPDVLMIDAAVMDGDWPREVRAEGGWGSGGGVTSILTLLADGVFTEEKAKVIRTAIGD